MQSQPDTVRGRVAVIADPQGTVLTLLEPRDGDPPDRPALPGEWSWNEVWSTDPDATLAFYQALVPAGTASLSCAQAKRPEGTVP